MPTPRFCHRKPFFLGRNLWLLIFGLTVCPAFIQAQSLLDPSFEDTTASTTVVNGGSGWTPLNMFCHVYSNSFGDGTTTYGSQYLYFADPTGDMQTISSGFTLGQVYRLTVQCADILGGTAPSMTLQVTGGATANQTFSFPGRTGPMSGPLPFHTYELDFTPTTNGPITIEIAGGSYPTAFDDITLSIPEPSIWTLLAGTGLVLAATSRRYIIFTGTTNSRQAP